MAIDPFFALAAAATALGNVGGSLAVSRVLPRVARLPRALFAGLAGWGAGIGAAWLAVRLVYGPPAPDALMPGVELLLAAGWGLLTLFALGIGRLSWRASGRRAQSDAPAP
jgi:apolipoprotein N-acyltransferase